MERRARARSKVRMSKDATCTTSSSSKDSRTIFPKLRSKRYCRSTHASTQRCSKKTPLPISRNYRHHDRQKVGTHHLHPSLVRTGWRQSVPVAGERVGYTVVQERSQEPVDSDRRGRRRSQL